MSHDPTPAEQERARAIAEAIVYRFRHAKGLGQVAAERMVAKHVTTALAEQRERYESALWIAGAFVEIYGGHVLDKLRADKMLRELGIRRWPDGSVDEPTAAATRRDDA